MSLCAPPTAFEEWRIHFHIPLHCPPTAWFDNTTDHLLGVLDVLAAQPGLCSHLEMETYTWEVMPPELKSRSVVDQSGCGIRVVPGTTAGGGDWAA